jgi:hypothetical protein
LWKCNNPAHKVLIVVAINSESYFMNVNFKFTKTDMFYADR